MPELEMMSFDEAMSWTSQGDETKLALLLGNGFSMSYDSERFSYGALATLAQNRDLLPKFALQVMSASDTPDFESLMRQLQDTVNTLTTLDAVEYVKLIDELKDAISGVREALAKSIAGLHPDRPYDIEDSSYASVRRFLDRFPQIYTVSYDLLLYWALMQDVEGDARMPDDGFRDSGVDGDDTVLWNIYDAVFQNVHYLHGALHLYSGSDGLRKITYVRTSEALIDQVRRQLALLRYPLYVAEGESHEKLARINASAYLGKALRSLSGRGNGLMVFGHSLDANDNHILEAIVRSKVRRLSISLYGDPQSSTNQEIQRRAADLSARRRIKKPNMPLEAQFFDASSVSLW
jgi:hypothetical protein